MYRYRIDVNMVHRRKKFKYSSTFFCLLESLDRRFIGDYRRFIRDLWESYELLIGLLQSLDKSAVIS